MSYGISTGAPGARKRAAQAQREGLLPASPDYGAQPAMLRAQRAQQAQRDAAQRAASEQARTDRCVHEMIARDCAYCLPDGKRAHTVTAPTGNQSHAIPGKRKRKLETSQWEGDTHARVTAEYVVIAMARAERTHLIAGAHDYRQAETRGNYAAPGNLSKSARRRLRRDLQRARVTLDSKLATDTGTRAVDAIMRDAATVTVDVERDATGAILTPGRDRYNARDAARSKRDQRPAIVRDARAARDAERARVKAERDAAIVKAQRARGQGSW